MTDNREHIEYELIDITFELPYVQAEDDNVAYVLEDGLVQEPDTPKIEYCLNLQIMPLHPYQHTYASGLENEGATMVAEDIAEYGK